MKQCPSCDQIVSEKIITCPACGSHLVDGIKYFDGYRIQAIIHEGRSSIVCKAKKEGESHSVSIRIFTKNSGVDHHIALRLEKELEELKKLPSQHFVQHYRVLQSSSGCWYRISEWVDAMDWGSIFMSGLINDHRRMITLFHHIASVLDLLHKKDHFMPYLILDDILIPKKNAEQLPVKINYKLSRFLNARATHHGPMLQKLLDCHPDIINQRPIDFKSAIWSLGKVFVELLTADPNLRAFSSKIDTIKGVDPELVVLIKLMLSDDPGLRPQTMARVASALSRILSRLEAAPPVPEKTGQKPELLRELQWFKRVVITLIFILFGLIGFGTISWFKMNTGLQKNEAAFDRLTESYARSVAFIMVEYGLSTSDEVVYKSKIEGTAFLADSNGYILTNRHVACPWLDDIRLFQAYSQSVQLEKPVEFNYQIYLWFEGAKAFNRLPALSESEELSDTYYLSAAYRTHGKGNLRIVGVPRSAGKTGQMIKSPFKNDYAVLKIDDLPKNLIPLPLDGLVDPLNIKRLSPIVILGFPLGNRTQADRINTSITRGHVRRTTMEIIQVDTSIYRGNSGGPAIDELGRVIGIASGVVTEPFTNYFKIDAPLSDFGLVLPITRPSTLIAAIKQGRPQWSGVLDFSIESKLEKITRLAVDNRFRQAADVCETMLKTSDDPVLIYVAGVLNFCSQDMEKAGLYFKKLSMIEPENTTARLLLYIIDWLQNEQSTRTFTKGLFTMDWSIEDEYLGYLAQTLKEGQRMSAKVTDFENRSEKSWRLFIEGLILEKSNQPAQACDMFKQSVLNANINDWVYFLSFSRLDRLQNIIAKTVKNKTAFQKKMKAFQDKAGTYRETAADSTRAMGTLISQIESDDLDHEKKIAIYDQLFKLAPENRNILGRITFFHAAHGDWQRAIDSIDLFFKHPTRQTALSLSLGLLKGQLLQILGKNKTAEAWLNQFSKTIQDPWYKAIIKNLLTTPDEKELIQQAGKKPEKLITAHTALGLWAESRQDKKTAARHYREALSSYLDDWNEYDLALSRIMAIRKPADKKPL